MASGAKLSKTARASIGKDKDSISLGKPCPQCATPMVATRVIKDLINRFHFIAIRSSSRSGCL